MQLAKESSVSYMQRNVPATGVQLTGYTFISNVLCVKFCRIQNQTKDLTDLVYSLSRVRLFATPWTAARQACFPVLHHLPEFAQTHVH